MIQDIFFIKQNKEQKAVDKLIQRKADVEKKKSTLKKKNLELKEYKNWRIQEESNIYDSILNKNIKQRKIDEIKHKIALLREKDVKMLEEINIATKQLNESKDLLNQAQDNYNKAFKEVEKFKEIVDIMDQEQIKEKNLLEDKEMEEFYNNTEK